MVLVHDMSSEFASQMYEVLLKHLSQLSSYTADTILWQTDWNKLWRTRIFNKKTDVSPF